MTADIYDIHFNLIQIYIHLSVHLSVHLSIHPSKPTYSCSQLPSEATWESNLRPSCYEGTHWATSHCTILVSLAQWAHGKKVAGSPVGIVSSPNYNSIWSCMNLQHLFLSKNFLSKCFLFGPSCGSLAINITFVKFYKHEEIAKNIIETCLWKYRTAHQILLQ